VIIFDCEVKHCIPDGRAAKDPALRYCEGWSDYAGMGISVICVVDLESGERYTITENLQLFAYLVNKADLVVGFNNHSFDDRLVAAHGINIPEHKSYDIYTEVLKAAGLHNAPYRKRKGYKLDDIARVNFHERKSEEGALAPVLYQQGEFARLHGYCMHDVEMTVQVLRRIMAGTLLCPRLGTVLNVRHPHEQIRGYERALVNA
jgi:hypothetical protein